VWLSVSFFCVCAGWFTSGAVLGGYGSAAQGGKVGPAALAAAKTWALGVPLGVAIRSVGRGYVPAMSFIGISLAVTGVLMVGWRTALAAVTPEVGWWRAAGQDMHLLRQEVPMRYGVLLTHCVMGCCLCLCAG
jgi:hypothetical protein